MRGYGFGPGKQSDTFFKNLKMKAVPAPGHFNYSRNLLRGRFVVLYFLFTIISLQIYGQETCSCPDICGPCSGSIISFRLQYKGSLKAAVFGKDAASIVFNGSLKPGDIFDVKGSDPNGRFIGNKIDLFVDDILNTSIPIICPNNVYVNRVFGNFVVVEARSKDRIRVCCETYTVADAVAPQFTLVPEDIVIELEGEECSAQVQWTVPQYIDCNKKSNGLTSNYSPGNSFLPGENEVKYTAVDQANNKTDYTFKVTVIDKSNPVFTLCPDDTLVKTKTPSGLPVEWDTPVAIDNCSVQSYASNISSGDVFELGDKTVNYTATDPSGNKSTCSFQVSVVPDEIDLDIERILTPDENGVNDSWSIGNIEEYPDNHIIIFDRWGNEVFNARGYDNDKISWRGFYPNSQKAPTGTYFYSITVKLDSKKLEQRGFIELIR